MTFFVKSFSQIAIFHIFLVLNPNLEFFFFESQDLASPRPPQVSLSWPKYQKLGQNTRNLGWPGGGQILTFKKKELQIRIQHQKNVENSYL